MKPDEPESEETRKFLDWMPKKYEDSMTPEEWRRLPKEMRQSTIEREREQFRREQEFEAKEFKKECDARWAEYLAEVQAGYEADFQRHLKENEQEKRKLEQMKRDEERKKSAKNVNCKKNRKKFVSNKKPTL
jgi:hypothetical protein